MINTQTVGDERAQGRRSARCAGSSRKTSELRAILDTATDGVLVLDRDGRVLSANRSAEALFGYEAARLRRAHLRRPVRAGKPARRARLSRPHRERRRRRHPRGRPRGRSAACGDGGLVPLLHHDGRGSRTATKLCAVLRDVTAWKRTEEELINARQQAERASTAKSEFLAKISHEIRTPLNAIIGFSEVMMDERFGPIGNERYRQYLKDIHASGGHLISLLNDLLDLSKIEAGKLELTFVSVDLNDLMQQCVAHHAAAGQPRARHHPHLAAGEPAADRRRRALGAPDRAQPAVELDQVHRRRRPGDRLHRASPTSGEVVLRVRDTGVGMSEKELQTALEPFRQLATSARWGSSGTGLGLPLTKALAEANHARFRITSAGR